MGDEYTPTTYGIRTNYGTARNPNGTTEQQFKQRTAEFDRWLNEYTASVLEDARNRLNGHDPAGEQLQRLADDMRGGIYIAWPLGAAMRGSLPTTAHTQLQRMADEKRSAGREDNQ